MAAHASRTASRTADRAALQRACSVVSSGAVMLSLTTQAVHASCPSTCPAPAVWSQPFAFAGFTWERKGGCGGPGPNCWAPENAEPIPGEGIRLRLTRVGGRWYAGEIRTTAPVGYGDYSVRVVGRPDLFDPSVVLGVFLYDDESAEAGEACPAELDMESSRFGDPQAPNGHAVVYVPGLCGPADLYDFDYALTGTYTTHQLSWGPGAAALRWLHGHGCAEASPELVIAQRSFTSPLVPAAGRMRLHINLWAFAGSGPADHQDVEIVIRDIVTTCLVAAAGPPAPADDATFAVRPNPIRDETVVWFVVRDQERVQLTVLDVSGRAVASLVDARLPAGPQRVRWASGSHPPGVYFVRLAIGSRVATRRVVVLP